MFMMTPAVIQQAQQVLQRRQTVHNEPKLPYVNELTNVKSTIQIFKLSHILKKQKQKATILT